MSDEKKYQWTIMFDYQKNGSRGSENFTIRTDDKEEYEKFITEKRGELPSAKTYPDDEGIIAQTQTVAEGPMCAVHKIPMKWKAPGVSRTGKPYPGFYSCGMKDQNGNFCNYRPSIK